MRTDVVSAWAACIQTVVFTVAALVAYGQVREARRLREAQAQPYVVVSLETEPAAPTFCYIVVKNIGSTVARNIRLSFDPMPVSTMDAAHPDPRSRLAEWSAVSDGITTLVPGQSLRSLFDSLISRYGDGGLARVTHVTVRYQGDAGSGRLRDYEYVYDLDFNVFYGAHFTTEKSAREIASAVESMARSIKDLVERDGLRVYVKDLAEYRAEWEVQIRDLLGRNSEEPAPGGQREPVQAESAEDDATP